MRCHFVSGDSSADAHWKNEEESDGVEFELVMMRKSDSLSSNRFF